MKKYFIIALTFLVAGCLPSVKPNSQAPITSTNILVSTDTAPVITSIPLTWTPLPTILPSEGMGILQLWLKGTDDCRLPCWAGIIPGKTTWDGAKQKIMSMSGFTTVSVVENTHCDFGKCNGVGWSLFPKTLADGGFYSKLPESKIHLMSLNIQDAGVEKEELLKYLDLRMILNNYGVPAMVFIFTEPDLPGQIFLEVTLVYPDNQFVISYSRYAMVESENVVSCGPDSSLKLIVLDNQEQLTSLETLSSAIETKDFHYDTWHKPIEEATGMNIGTFYEIFSQENAPCIVTPTRIWQP